MMSSFDEAAEKLGHRPGQVRDPAQARPRDHGRGAGAPRRRQAGGVRRLRIQHNMGLGPFLGPLRSTSQPQDRRAARAGGVDDLEVRAAQRALRRLGGRHPHRPRRRSPRRARARGARYTASLLDDIGPDATCSRPTRRATRTSWPGSWTPSVQPRAAHDQRRVTGKPLEMGGSRHHDDAVAQGLRVVLRLPRALRPGRPGRRCARDHPGRRHGGRQPGAPPARRRTQGDRLLRRARRLFDEQGLDVPALLAWREHRLAQGTSPASCERIDERRAGRARPATCSDPLRGRQRVHSRNAAASRRA
jgi:glutamate dehydrogenase (NAD(P)+)